MTDKINARYNFDKTQKHSLTIQKPLLEYLLRDRTTIMPNNYGIFCNIDLLDKF